MLSVTDQPGLLEALEAAFRLRARLGSIYAAAAPPGHETRCGLFMRGKPDPFLKIVSANPNLPRPPAQPADIDLALLALLKDRPRLLPAFEQGALAERLLEYLGTWMPEPVHDRCRRALRNLSAPDGVAVVCDQAILGNAEAVAAARDAGYLPARPSATPIFLLLTRQFAAYRQADPDGQVLQLLCSDVRSISASYSTTPRWTRKDIIDRVIDQVMAILNTDLPDDVAAAVRRSLRDLGPLGDRPEDHRRHRMRQAASRPRRSILP